MSIRITSARSTRAKSFVGVATEKPSFEFLLLLLQLKGVNPFQGLDFFLIATRHLRLDEVSVGPRVHSPAKHLLQISNWKTF